MEDASSNSVLFILMQSNQINNLVFPISKVENFLPSKKVEIQPNCLVYAFRDCFQKLALAALL